MSTYSLRKNFARGNFTFGDFAFMKDQFPEVEGLEVLLDHLERYDYDENIEELKKSANNSGLSIFGLTTGSGEFGSNQIPHYHPLKEYLEGFEFPLQNRIGVGLDWIEMGNELGVELMRIDFGKFFFNHKIPISKAIDFNIDQNIKAYSEFCQAAKFNQIMITIENHGGFASDLTVLRRLFDAVPNLKLCYDIGNLPDYDRYRIIDEMGDRIGFVHAKTYEFDENGEEKYFDFGKIISKLKDSRFDGWLSVEFEGPGDEISGVRKTIDLIKKYL